MTSSSCVNSEPAPAPFGAMAPLFRYWRDLPPPRPRAAVDPLALGGELLDHVNLGHYLGDFADLRYDLIGKELKRVAPRLVPGSLTSDVLHLQQSDFDMVHNLLCAVGRAGLPRVYRIDYRSLELKPRRIYAMLLPLGGAGEALPAEDLLFGVWSIRTGGRVPVDRFYDLTDDFLKTLAE